jgi:hypothetical protein
MIVCPAEVLMLFPRMDDQGTLLISRNNSVTGQAARREARVLTLAALLQLRNELFDGDPGTPDQRPQGSAVKVFMIRYGEMSSVGVIQNHMASLLTVKEKSEFLKCFYRLTARDNGERSHLGSDANFYNVRGWDREMLGFADFDDGFNGFPDVLESFVTRLPLRHTARERRTFRHDVAIFTRSQRDKILVRHKISPFVNTSLSQYAFSPQFNPINRDESEPARFYRDVDLEGYSGRTRTPNAHSLR